MDATVSDGHLDISEIWSEEYVDEENPAAWSAADERNLDREDLVDLDLVEDNSMLASCFCINNNFANRFVNRNNKLMTKTASHPDTIA